MNAEIDTQISKEEIDWVKAKHAGIHKAARHMLKDAIEVGQWFNEAAERTGFELKKGNRGGTWHLWVRATFSEIGPRTVQRYMRLARGRDYLAQEFPLDNGRHVSRDPLTIQQALRSLSQRDREAEESKEPDLSPAEFEEPLLILRDQLKGYVIEMFQLKYKEDQIKFRIKNAKLRRRQIRQAVEWACREHLEIKDLVLTTFLGAVGK